MLALLNELSSVSLRHLLNGEMVILLSTFSKVCDILKLEAKYSEEDISSEEKVPRNVIAGRDSMTKLPRNWGGRKGPNTLIMTSVQLTIFLV